MDWSQKRKIIYALSFAGIIILLAAYPVYLLTSKPATCFDGRKNGNETGVDCGGGCALVCTADIIQPRAIWAKAFPTKGNTYDLGAYIENPNANAGVKSARYTISVLDSNGNTLVQRNGTTELPPASRLLLFDAGVSISGVPSSVEVSFNSNDLTRWIRATTAPSSVVTKNQNLQNTDTTPRFDAVLVNTDPVNDVSSLTLAAIIYDTARNPVAISKTYVDNIPKGGEQSVFFTWPSKFTKHAHGETCRIPLDTMFVLDRSENMNIGNKQPTEPLETVKNAAISYLNYIGASDKVGLVSFASPASSTVDYELSSDHVAASSTIAALSTRGATQNTNLGDALNAALLELQSSRHTAGANEAIIAITDGNTTRPLDPLASNNKQYALDYAAGIASAAHKSGVNIYAISAGKNINEPFLRNQIASDVSRYFSTSTPDVLQTIYNTASAAVCPPENFITEIVVTPRAIFAE